MSIEIGRRIKNLRESNGLTQEELGNALGGLGKAAVQKIEAGKTNIGADKIKILCKVFKVLPSSLLFDSFLDFWQETFGIKLDANDAHLGDMESLISLNALAEARFGSKGVGLLHSIDALNEVGIERAITYVGDLSRIDDYRKSEKPM